MGGNTVLKKIYIIMALVILAALTGIMILLQRSVEPEKYVLDHVENATEILCVEQAMDDIYLVFFVDDQSYVNCGIVKKTSLGCRLMDISGRLIEGIKCPYLFSCYRDSDRYFSVYWGLPNASVRQVTLDSERMNLTEASAAGVRIAWLFSEGQIPDCMPTISQDGVALSESLVDDHSG